MARSWHRHCAMSIGTLSFPIETTHNRHVSNNNWHMACGILDDIFVFHHLGISV